MDRGLLVLHLDRLFPVSTLGYPLDFRLGGENFSVIAKLILRVKTKKHKMYARK